MEVFAHGGDIYCASASQMFGVPVEKHGVNGHLRQKGKIAELALGYGGSVGALKAMGALEMGLTEEELPTLVRQWRSANPHITRLWWDVDEAVMTAVRDKTSTYAHGIRFHVPDRLILLPGGKVGFVECKAPGKQLRPLQVHRKRQLEGLGFLVYCLDSPEAIGGILDEILCS